MKISERFIVGLFMIFGLAAGILRFSQPTRAAGTVNLDAFGSPYNQDFNTLASSGTTNTTVPSGWDFSESGANANTTYRAGTGSDNTGDTYSFGASGDSERAFGGLRSGNLVPLIGAQFTNNTGGTITELVISYTGEQWRLGQNTTGRAADQLDFQISTDATSLTTGTWNDYNSLDFLSPVVAGTIGALNGNVLPNQTALNFTITGLGIPNGASFWIRWADTDLIPGADDGLSVDDFSLTPNGSVPTVPSLSINDVSAVEGNSGTTAFDFTVSLSSPAGAGGVTFDIGTADNTATSPDDFTALALTGQSIAAGSSSYTFTVLVNGDIDPEANETFSVNATNVAGAVIADGQGQGTIVDDGDVCAQPFVSIYQIQGSGLAAAITGNVTTQGVVVGDFEGTASASGFYIQDLTGDGDTATSDGIFVFTGSSNLVSIGQVVRVTGYARERFNQTTLNGSNSNTSAVPAANILQCGTGSVTPVDVTLPVTNIDDFERFEGMLVRFPQALVISEYFNYERFGEMVLALPLAGETRAFSGTAIDEPGAAANARTAANALSRITLDDAQSAQNPSTLRHPNGLPFSLSNLFRGGDTVQNAMGVLGFDFSLYRIVPTSPADYAAANPRPAFPEPLGGTVRVAAMNTLNYFLTPDNIQEPSSGPDNPADNICGPVPSLECRGWDGDQPLELDRQRVKLLEALAGLDADIIGLNELENTISVDPLGDPTSGIVPGLNAMLGAGTYTYVDTGVIGTDAIKVGMIYRPAAVTPVGAFQILDSTDDPRFIDTKSRPSLAQTFEVNATGARFTVVVNHLKSKGSDCLDVGDPDLGDGQGNCSQTRRAAAEALVDWLASDPTGSSDPDFIIIGDLNSYAQEDTIDEIKAGSDDVAGTSDDFTNLIAHFQGAFAYSYTFDGQAGYLDHALANASLFAQITGATEWHINSDEPDVLDYDTSFKPATQEALYEVNAYRTSDHDPVVVGLNPINNPPVASAGGPYSGDEGGTVALTASGYDPDGTAVTFAWDLDNDNIFETPGQAAMFSAVDGTFDYTLNLQVTDGTGLSTITTTIVSVNNIAPDLDDLSLSQTLVQVGASVTASAGFTDPGILDTHTASIDWGDGSVEQGSVSETDGSGTASGAHVYTTAGIYTVSMIVTDKDGGADTSISTQVVVYDPNGRFVTGGGWINSPAGAYTPDPDLTGKAIFSFVARYRRGASVPNGTTQFYLHAGRFRFRSTALEWLVVANRQAQLKGTGIVNGQDGYKFMLWADDSHPDTFRIKVWYEDSTGEHVIYDNGADQAIGGGSIVVHK